jgi:hypothetical protein
MIKKSQNFKIKLSSIKIYELLHAFVYNLFLLEKNVISVENISSITLEHNMLYLGVTLKCHFLPFFCYFLSFFVIFNNLSSFTKHLTIILSTI